MVCETTKKLFFSTPREVASPYRFVVNNTKEIERFLSDNNGIHDCYISVYKSNGIVDKIFWDFDYGPDVLADTQKMYKWCLDNELQAIPIISGLKGFHIYIILHPHLYKAKTKILLTKATFSILKSVFGPFKQIMHPNRNSKLVRKLRTEERIIGPDPAVMGDIRRICVLPSTVIVGVNRQIVDISKGDMVIGSDVLRNKVESTMSRTYTGDMIRVHASGILFFDITPNHQILVVEACSRNVDGDTKVVLDDKVQYKKSSELVPKRNVRGAVGDYLLIPIHKGYQNVKSMDLEPFTIDNFVNKYKFEKIKYLTNKGWSSRAIGRELGLEHKVVLRERKEKKWILSNNFIRLDFPINEDTAWLLGLYVAEGCPKKWNGEYQGFNISLHKKETNLSDREQKILKELGYASYIQLAKETKGMVVICSSRVLARAFECWCGSGAHNKKIPDFIFFHSSETIVKSFLDGYFCGDGGCFKPEGRSKRYGMTTVSKVLALQLQLLFARFKIFVHINEGKPTEFIKGRRCFGGVIYRLFYTKSTKARHRYVGDKYIATRISKVEKIPYSGMVCNMKTNDNTYLVNNIVVHNCRVPNSLRPPENINYCTYLPPETFLEMTTQDCSEHMKSTHHYDYKIDFNKAPLLTDFEYEFDDVDFQKWETIKGTNTVSIGTSNPNLFLKNLLRPCLYRHITSTHPGHEARAAVAIDLLHAGYNPEEIADMFSMLGWEDFERNLTISQIKSCRKYEPYSCSKLRSLSLPKICCVG